MSTAAPPILWWTILKENAEPSCMFCLQHTGVRPIPNIRMNFIFLGSSIPNIDCKTSTKESMLHITMASRIHPPIFCFCKPLGSWRSATLAGTSNSPSCCLGLENNRCYEKSSCFSTESRTGPCEGLSGKICLRLAVTSATMTFFWHGPLQVLLIPESVWLLRYIQQVNQNHVRAYRVILQYLILYHPVVLYCIVLCCVVLYYTMYHQRKFRNLTSDYTESCCWRSVNQEMWSRRCDTAEMWDMRIWRVGSARNAVFFHSFVASQVRKVRS